MEDGRVVFPFVTPEQLYHQDSHWRAWQAKMALERDLAVEIDRAILGAIESVKKDLNFGRR